MSTALDEGVGFRSRRGPILIALMLATGLVAIDATIVATAVPSIVEDIGGFASFPWLFSAYLLAQAVSVPVYAKLSDVVGRKPMILGGIGLFLLGSILCGLAWSMPALIAFRVLQGLGAGAVQPVAITIAGDIYTLAERAKVQGYLASVWAVSSVVGPTLGGVFASLGIWRWIFLINIPLCLLAGWMLLRTFHENVERTKHRIDYLGAGLLTVSLSLLILGALQGGQAWPWDSAISISVFAGGAVLFVAFLLAERKAAEPILPPWVVSRRLLATTALISFGVGAVMLGLTSYVPTFLEGALKTSPLLAGLALAALTIGWPISASQAGRFYLRIGFRNTAIIGIAITVIGAAVLAFTAATPNILLVAMACFIVGLGLGLVATPSLIAAQTSVEWNERGVVTGTNLFARSIGSSIGVAVFGAIANAIYANGPSGGPDPHTTTHASSAVFMAVLVSAVLTVVAVLVMPADKKRSTKERVRKPSSEPAND
ncbi:MFS transporter [Paenarthrobacter aurescens]|uniref:MFS transporter n=1 Tax=Paenarthrobacter aurescens TaxID=43663 RepID=A0A4Y3NI43_PAEAU|nr:MFS transporter [Paenarthrobacter aurescens]MDO6142202.1 MFS transporter [Paenarthrobacter aurescens]MDO6146050.1 MFS transporter [Paenarthrobacter aurescens]MDO6157294.1 MFS transporter [Paenarthrobacter aurescens]MDO6161279.1 MFS transporter [Paenarthrobacter aurescens]GEB20135.1 MFS transporter [Paenarthrobacter aurescens]